MPSYEPNRGRLPHDCCEHLCAKTMYMASEDQDFDKVEEFDGFQTAHYWCALNQMPLGPDGDEVAPDTCRPGRACCVPRLKVPEV
ncbi:MAG: hypothetical protein HRU14_02820 [Planctomycetes bacterium]|nr:hypothetical protein [Planctomycetota bacterium]